MTREQIAERIVDSLVGCGCTTFPYEFYQEQKQEAVAIILESLEGYILVQGDVIE